MGEHHKADMKHYDATAIRQSILDMAFSGSTVHIGCAFSIVELLAVLYRQHLRSDPVYPAWPGRDYLVLSKGHGVMAQYACLRELGVLTDVDLKDYFKDGTRLKGLADAHVPGIEATTGSLGHGLSVAVGLALAAKLNQTDQACYALVGDGELNEGSMWEALLFAAHFKLDNLLVIVDNNGFQATGTTDEVMALGNVERKFQAFGFDTLSIDGHDEQAIDSAYASLKVVANGRPKAIVANTVKGKGVSFMENNNHWHYSRLNAQTYSAASAELASNRSAT